MSRPRAPLQEIGAVHPERNRIAKAAALLAEDGVVVIPTDTIYALVADMESRKGIERLYAARRLERGKRLSLIARSISEISAFARLRDDAHRFMRRALPGPYTMILPATKDAPKLGVDKDRRQIGVRIPNHAVPLALAEALGRPLMATSALVDEEAPDALSDPRLIRDRFATDVDLVFDAGILEGTPSTIIDWCEDPPQILRVGAGDVSELLP